VAGLPASGCSIAAEGGVVLKELRRAVDESTAVEQSTNGNSTADKVWFSDGCSEPPRTGMLRLDRARVMAEPAPRRGIMGPSLACLSESWYRWG
jgi:hypothetical protein